MKATVKLNAFYMVTFRNGAFRAIIGWRVVDYIRAQRERAERSIEAGGDIVSMYELPDGYIGGLEQ